MCNVYILETLMTGVVSVHSFLPGHRGDFNE